MKIVIILFCWLGAALWREILFKKGVRYYADMTTTLTTVFATAFFRNTLPNYLRCDSDDMVIWWFSALAAIATDGLYYMWRRNQ